LVEIVETTINGKKQVPDRREGTINFTLIPTSVCDFLSGLTLILA